MMRTSTHLAFVLLVTLPSGCAHSGQQPAAEVAGGAETTPTPSGPVLAVLEAGAEPRQALRYDVEEGRTDTIRIDLFISLSTAVGDVAAEVEEAPTRFVFEVGPVHRLEGGRFSYRVRISDVEVIFEQELDAESVALVQETLRPLTTLEGWVTVDATGVVQQASINVPAELPARTRTALGNIWTSLVSVPLPTEPVGVGARWQVQRAVELPQLTVHQTTTYTVTDLTDGGATLQTTVRQTAPAQPMRGLEEGQSGRVESYEASGVGSVHVDLRRLASVAEIDVTTQMRASITAEGESRPMMLRMRTRVQAEGDD